MKNPPAPPRKNPRHARATVAATLLLAAVATLPAAPARADDDPLTFLRPDVGTGCTAPAPAGLTTYRRHDWGGPDAPRGYGASDNCDIWTDAVLNTADFAANAPPGADVWNPWQGSGGQILQVVRWDILWHPHEPQRVLFWGTQDYTTWQNYLYGRAPSGFENITGGGCGGGSGWLLFFGRDDGAPSVLNAPVTPWQTEVAPASADFVGGTTCPPMAPYYTQFMRGPAQLPYQTDGTRAAGTLDVAVIVTEHYNTGDPATATAMERNYFARGYGLVYWQAVSRAPPVGADLAQRCPKITVNGYTDPPGWTVSDCRYWLNFVAAPDGFSARGWGWPWWQPL